MAKKIQAELKTDIAIESNVHFLPMVVALIQRVNRRVSKRISSLENSKGTIFWSITQKTPTVVMVCMGPTPTRRNECLDMEVRCVKGKLSMIFTLTKHRPTEAEVVSEVVGLQTHAVYPNNI